MNERFIPVAVPVGNMFIPCYRWMRVGKGRVHGSLRGICPLRPVSREVALKIAARFIRSKLNKPVAFLPAR